MNYRPIAMLLAVFALLIAGCPEEDDDGGGGGGGSSPSSVIEVSRVGVIADGGTDNLGSVSTLSAVPTLTYLIGNTGTADLNLTGGPNFVVVSNESNIVGTVTVTQPASGTIAASGSEMFDLDFQVAAAGAFSFDVSIATDADSGQSGATFDFTVSGTGDNSTRILVVSRSGTIADGGTDALGDVDATAPAPTLTYTLTNNGTGPMSLLGGTPYVTVSGTPTNISGGAGGIAITQPGSATIASGGGTEMFDVDFQVGGAGAFSFTLQFSTDATSGQTGATFEIIVSGTGTLPSRTIEVSRAWQTLTDGGTLDLGNRGWGVTNYEVRIEIENTGTSDLTLTGTSPWVNVATSPASVNITSVNITQPASAVIAGGTGVFFTFTFEVTALGDFSFTLQFGSDATSGQSGATFEINVEGRGHPSFTFEKQFPTTSREPYTVGVDENSPEIRLVSGGFANGGTQFPSNKPSPNGQYILYTYQGSGTTDDRHMYVVPAAGGNPVQVTPSSTATPPETRRNVEAEWGENAVGDQLLCIMADHESSANDKKIYTCVVSGTGATPVVSNFTEVTGYGAVTSTRKAFTAKWSPDGTRLAFQLFTSGSAGFERELWGCAFTGGVPSTATDLKGTVAIANTTAQIGGNARNYYWANASTLVYSVDEVASGGQHIFAVNVTLNGGVLVAGAQVLQSPYTTAAQGVGNYETAWEVSSTGERLAYIFSGSGIDFPQIVQINTSSQPTPVQAFSGLTAQANADGNRLRWTPDGTVLLYAGDYTTDTAFDLYFQRLTSATGMVTLSGSTVRMTNHAADNFIAWIEPAPGNTRVAIEHNVPDGSSGYFDQIEVISIEASPVVVVVANNFTNAYANALQIGWKPGAGDFLAYNANANSSDRELFVIPFSGPDLMTPGSTYTVSGSFANSGLSNYKWVP